jgi:hypothetical protein
MGKEWKHCGAEGSAFPLAFNLFMLVGMRALYVRMCERVLDKYYY